MADEERMIQRRQLNRYSYRFFTALLLAALQLRGQAVKHAAAAQSDWPVYGGQPAADHYSPLAQINRTNVKRLRMAWQFDAHEEGGLETSPIVVGRVLFGYTATQKVIALDAVTGKLLWMFDSGVHSTQPARGVTYWTDGHSSVLFAGVMNFLYALDPRTGKPIASFGEQGRIDLRKDLRGDFEMQSVSLTSPGIVYKDLIIVGGRNPETYPAPPGDIRAFDVHTGRLRWRFHTIPHPGEPGYETWPPDAWKTAGAANNWAGMALDERRGIVYVPTGSPVFDFYGADRVGDDLYADSLLALDAATGKLLWHFQGVHHDIWDRDFPSPPALLTVMHNGRRIDAVAQTTKQGYLFVLDRVTGKPVFPVEERKAPASDVPGEVTSPTQPAPTLPAPYTRQLITAEMLTQRTPEAHAKAVSDFSSLRTGDLFTPPGLDEGTIVFPGFLGGAEWGGPAVDPAHGTIFINANETAYAIALTANKPGAGTGERTYRNQCALCHGKDRSGSPPAYPSLVDIGKYLSVADIHQTVLNGRGRMPGFPNLKGDYLDALTRYLVSNGVPEQADPDHAAIYSASAEGSPMAYEVTGSREFRDAQGYPALTPPWGTLNAIDLNTGRYLWKVPLGEYPELTAQGVAATGTENYGGPIVTGGGLLFIGATIFDKQLRAIDTKTGKVVWQATLPYANTATPVTYMVGGKQYVVVSCGGKDPKSPSGSMYVAFALP